MERTRNGPLPLVVPALVVLPVAGLAILFSIWRWHEADSRASLTRRVADSAAAAERLLDASVERQSETTRVLATSPAAWLWVKFQGQRLTPSNRSHAQSALQEITSFAGLLPGVTVYLASERTRTVYQAGAAVAALSGADPGDAWYRAALSSEGVVVSDDPRQVRTSMRVMNGKDLIGAVSCVGDVSRLAESALAGADDERGFTFILADREGSIVLSRGPQIGTAATVFDLFDSAERSRLRAAMEVVARPAGIMVDSFASTGRRVLAAVARTRSPGWFLLVSSEIPPVPPGRIVAAAAMVAAALAFLAAALLLIGLVRARRIRSLVDDASRQRDESLALARETETRAARLRETAVTLRERGRALAAEAAAGSQAAADTVREVGQAEERSTELRAGLSARASALPQITAAVKEAGEAVRQAQSSAAEAGRQAEAVEEEVNRIITTGTAVTLALENASKAAEGAAERAERARMLALNSSLEASRPGSAGRVGAQAAEEMRRLAEGASESARVLAGALEEAREALRVVSRLAQESGTSAHDAAARCADAAGRMQAAVRAVEQGLSRLDAAQAGAASLPEGVVASDRARSATEGVARILERIAVIGGEISSLAEEMASWDAARKPAAAGPGEKPPP